MRDDSAEILSFLQETIATSSGMGRNIHSLMLSIQHFICRRRRRPSSKVPLGMVFREAVVACDMPELREFPSLDSRQKEFLWAQQEVDLATQPVVGLVL